MAPVVAVVSFGAVAWQVQQPPPTAAQQRPVFRGGTHFVRVDAYPVQDGKIVEGLEPEDFEILEDGKRQKIESFDFIRFDTFTPEAERRNPSSQREGFELAADPRYRVFVIFVDLGFSKGNGVYAPIEDIGRIQQPLVNFIERVIGVHDLFGLLSSRNSVRDLVLGQKTTVTAEQVRDLWRASFVDDDGTRRFDPQYDPDCVACREGARTGRTCATLQEGLKARYHADQTYTLLRDLIALLGAIREERKNVVFVSNQLLRWREDQDMYDRLKPGLPKMGIDKGRVGLGDPQRTPVTSYSCADDVNRLPLMDFETRYQQVLTEARRANVAFYPIPPSGLQAPSTLGEQRVLESTNDDLRSLARETGGIAAVDSNDLNAGMKKIADDLQAYYVLGYYTTNAKFDGRVRKITVKLKGSAIRARREYRAPTEAEIAALASGVGASSSAAAGVPPPPSPYETALVALERASRPFAVYTAAAGKQLTVVTELSAASILAGKWKDGADVEVIASGTNGEAVATARGKIDADAYSASINLPLPAAPVARVAVYLKGAAGGPSGDDWILLRPATGTLVGEALAYRTGPRAPTRPVATFEFARNERIRAEWPMLATLDRREVRLLDKTGKALPVELPLSEDAAKNAIVVEMSLSGLGHGDYLLELTAGAGATTERRLLAVRIR